MGWHLRPIFPNFLRDIFILCFILLQNRKLDSILRSVVYLKARLKIYKKSLKIPKFFETNTILGVNGLAFATNFFPIFLRDIFILCISLLQIFLKINNFWS